MSHARSRNAGTYAAAVSLLKGAGDAKLVAVLKLAVYAAIPLVPTLIELTSWTGIHRVPGTTFDVNVIFAWAAMTTGAIVYEGSTSGQRSVQWLTYWNDRGRILAGNLEQIGCYLVYQRSDGKRPSLERVGAGVLEQIATIVRDLTQPPDGVHIMACMLVPVTESIDGKDQVIALDASVYNQNAGRNFSRVPIDAPGPASEAYREGRPIVVPDTGVDLYRDQFAGKPYKSVMAFPVSVGRSTGAKIAIVTIDATEPNFFSYDVLEKKGIQAAIHPYLTVIGLLRVAEKKGGSRGRK